MPDTEPVKPLQGSVSGMAFHLQAPLRVSAFQRGYRPELVGTVVANGAGGSSIVGTVRIVWWQQVLYPALTLAMLTCVFILGGPIGLVVLGFGAAVGLVWSARTSTQRATDVISATSRAAAPLP
ncbi:hypothetical protein [Nocardioides baekrokdamisoli]|nr:hypothetical protein [Nocardioides baekrokdamisoli]